MRTTFSCFQDTRSGHSFSTPLRLSRPALERRGKTPAVAGLAPGMRTPGGVRPREFSASRPTRGMCASQQEQQGRICALPTFRRELCAPPLARKHSLRRSSASAQIKPCAALSAHRPFERGLTTRSRRPSTATSFGPAAGTPYIFCARAKAGSRSGSPQLER
jgi:hypothetical protein